MYKDFKEHIIRLMQHPVMNKPVASMTDMECQQAYELITDLAELSFDEEYTQIDYMQMARLKLQLGNLANALGDCENAINHYFAATQQLEKAGIDLSLNKWMELVSLRTKR